VLAEVGLAFELEHYHWQVFSKIGEAEVGLAFELEHYHWQVFSKIGEEYFYCFASY
jgi:hypothetical protein